MVCRTEARMCTMQYGIGKIVAPISSKLRDQVTHSCLLVEFSVRRCGVEEL